MRPFFFLCITLLASLMLSACGGGESKAARSPSYMLYSPNGEPLNGGPLGRPSCEAALSGWFSRLSANGSGVLTQEAFLQDAERQFRVMDIDHNGYLVSEELERYRAPFRQEEGKVGKLEKQTHKKARKEAEKPTAPQTLIDPVMSADSNLDFKVTLAEFMVQARKNFSELDTDHDGKLQKNEVVGGCEEK